MIPKCKRKGQGSSTTNENGPCMAVLLRVRLHPLASVWGKITLNTGSVGGTIADPQT